MSGMITVPLPVYQTVVANIQGSDGQPLQVVTPIVQVPKLEPGLEGGVEVSPNLNASLDATTIISPAQGHVQVRREKRRVRERGTDRQGLGESL